MEPHENRLLGEENADDIVTTLSQVHTETASPEDEAELAEIWQHEAKLREIMKSTQESRNVASATMRP